MASEADPPFINMLMLSAQLSSALFGFYFIFTSCLVQYFGLLEKFLRAPLWYWGSLLYSEGVWIFGGDQKLSEDLMILSCSSSLILLMPYERGLCFQTSHLSLGCVVLLIDFLENVLPDLPPLMVDASMGYLYQSYLLYNGPHFCWCISYDST